MLLRISNKTLLIILPFILLGCNQYCNPEKQRLARDVIKQDPYLDSLLSRAIADTRMADVDEIQTLGRVNTAIETIGKKQYVKGATWIEQPHEAVWFNAIEKPDNKLILEKGTEVWMTLIPEVQSFCQRNAFDNIEALKLRLIQKLGLDYKRSYSYFVEVLIPIEALCRPCLDPDVNKTQCLTKGAVLVNSPHAEWYYQKRAQLKGKVATPFTGLGYTYDWRAGEPEKGFDEYVFIADGKTAVLINKMYSLADYCAPLGKTND